MKTTPIILSSAAVIILGLMFWPKVIVTIGTVIAILIMVACCFAPFFVTHPACTPEDDLASQPAKPETSSAFLNSVTNGDSATGFKTH